MGPLNEIAHAFDHLSTQLVLVGLKVKVSKCKLWSPSRISPGIERNSSMLPHVHRWITHFGCANGFSGLCHTFFG